MTLGDPTVAGWFIVACYFAGATLCGIAVRAAWVGSRMAGTWGGEERRARARAAAYRASMLFWIVLATLFVFLGFNKQIDLQTWLTVVGRRSNDHVARPVASVTSSVSTTGVPAWS